MTASVVDEFEADARSSLALFCFGDASEYTLVSQQVHPASGRLRLQLDERVLRSKGNDSTLYVVRAAMHIPAAQLCEVLPILMDGHESNMQDTAQFFFGSKVVEYDEIARTTTDSGSSLSVKTMVADQNNMLKSRFQASFVDFSTVISPDWMKQRDMTDMHVRVIQSLPEPLDANKDKPIAPRGFMARESPDGTGVDVQCAMSFVEAGLINLPRRSRYQRLALGVLKLEDIVVSRRVSRSFRERSEPSAWVSDGVRQTCHICVTKFRVNKRRHHCRLCGEVACDTCAPKVDIVLPAVSAENEPRVSSVRICMACVHKDPASMPAHQQSPPTPSTSFGSTDTPRRRARATSIVDAISDAMYFKQGTAVSPDVAANGPPSCISSNDSCGSDSGTDDLDSDERLLNLSLGVGHLSNPMAPCDDFCACCHDTLGAIRYECAGCTDMVCGACNLQVYKRRGRPLHEPENLCRACVLADQKAEQHARPPAAPKKVVSGPSSPLSHAIAAKKALASKSYIGQASPLMHMWHN
ncbi:hypothetical protein H310_08951 [Aphanomyces invadans]|uniref:FYVE-type domain-containing protein n=1 Tax=Aphanomyces invadans TaxID=157072 RepID=A0A024TX64_9STRA|nr:hypothetical protein H310_08951 [Aphanomyces invadans]ETV98231.1 hypothetical protein H310_08951 [Aphanomyces invadans]|eukprot:XP_008873106.1 hypothetical protein H310_08951 [Aphanomyces invadans]